MRLLIANLVAYSHYVSREFAWIMRELIDHYEWRHLEPTELVEGAGTVAEKIERHLGMMPSLILPAAVPARSLPARPHRCRAPVGQCSRRSAVVNTMPGFR